eukprot:g1600.t1
MLSAYVTSAAGALLAVLIVRTQFAGAAFSTHQMRALATTSTSTSSECPTELSACALDAECKACVEAYTATFDPCVGSTSTSATCGDFEDWVCCASGGCEDNVAYAEYMGCALTGVGCGVIDVATCTAASNGASTTDPVPTTTSSTTTTVDDTSFTTSGVSTMDDMTTTSTTFTDDTTTTTYRTAAYYRSTTAAMDDTTLSTTDACQAELAACFADEACLACREAIVAESEAVEAICHPSDYDVDTSTCDDDFEVACCSIDEGPACSNGDALMVAWIECTIRMKGCDYSLADCAATGADSTGLVGGDVDSATAPAAVGGAAAGRVAFLYT